jgi:hypothetical protein
LVFKSEDYALKALEAVHTVYKLQKIMVSKSIEWSETFADLLENHNI